MISSDTRKVLGSLFRQTPKVACCAALVMTTPSSWAEPEPVCRWLQLDETRVYQCAVLPDVAVRENLKLVDGLPDPTLPLSEQSVSMVQQQTPRTSVRMPSAASKVVTTEKAVSGAKFMVLGVGDIAALTSRLEAEDDAHYSLLRTRNRLSLGVFSNEDNARNRQLALQRIGVETEIESLSRQRQRENSSGSRSSIAKQQVTEPKDEVLRADSEASRSQRSGYTQLPIANVGDRDYALGMLVKAVSEHLTPNDEIDVATIDREQTEKPTVTGYIVASLGEVDSVLTKLEALRANDYVLLRSGPYANRVSVGVYTTVENAFARQAFFAEQGISTEVISRADEKVVVNLPKPAPEYSQIALIPLDI